MEYKKFKTHIIARIDRGEEVVASLTKIVEKEHIALANVSAIGATDLVTAGVYSVSEKSSIKKLIRAIWK